MKILAVVQARMGSSRLPGKVMLPLAGRPLLQRMVERVRATPIPFEVIVATTTSPEDDCIDELCQSIGVGCFRGHPTDLLDRHYRAGMLAGADVVVKIPSDCPLVDPGVIQRVIGTYIKAPERWDYVSNLHPPTYPDGNDVEVVPMEVLTEACLHAEKSFEREHTTPFIWDNPERFRVGNVTWERGLDLSMSHRWTVDYPEDYELVARIYGQLWTATRPVFSLDEILALLQQKPEIQSINARYAGVNWYRTCLDELRTITADRTRDLESQL